jgi:hypothetical protein
MPATLARTRGNVDAHTRTLAKSLELTITVKAYDNGMVEVFGEPINNSQEGYDAGHGWLGAAECITLALGEFRRQTVARRKKIKKEQDQK